MAERNLDQIIQRLAVMINQNIQRELELRDQAIGELQQRQRELQTQLEACQAVLRELQAQAGPARPEASPAPEWDAANASVATAAAPDYSRPGRRQFAAIGEGQGQGAQELPGGRRPSGKNSYVGMSVLIDNYNRVVSQPQLENDFRDKYGPERFAVVNRRDRRLDPEEPPVFAKGGGDYWGIATKTPNHYLIVPRIGLVYDAELHRAGGMGEVFRPDGYREGASGLQLLLVRPAVMRLQNEQWELVEAGEIRLVEPLSPAAAGPSSAMEQPSAPAEEPPSAMEEPLPAPEGPSPAGAEAG